LKELAALMTVLAALVAASCAAVAAPAVSAQATLATNDDFHRVRANAIGLGNHPFEIR
jgi:hypothetical protein